MKSFKLLTAFAAFATLAFTACNSGSSTKDAARESLATTNTTTPAATPTAAPEANIPAGPLTTVSFPETIFDFGEIEEGEKVTHVYPFKNTGSHPLIISNAKGSCGCTVPDWPREPIPPGESGEIRVQYDSKGKGQVEGRAESKRVTITANTDPANSYLTIKGKVFKPATPES